MNRRVYLNINSKYPVIAWWSGGVTSAVACKLCIELYGIDNVRIVFIDTKNEDHDTYRFKSDCERWYEKKIETISNPDWESIQDVWYRLKSLNVAKGAICSDRLKSVTRHRFQTENKYSYQAFGFDVSEMKRIIPMKSNHPTAFPIFPLVLFGYSKIDCIEILQNEEISIPRAYKWGFNNNNCLKTGCVQGGIGYWQKMQTFFPEKFDAMANVEHQLTDLKGQPVTMLKDQSIGGDLVFLKPHLNYPHIKDISMMKGRLPKPLMECNGFCGTNDLVKNETELEINFDQQ